MLPIPHIIQLRVDKHNEAQAVCLQCGLASTLVQYNNRSEMVFLTIWPELHHWETGAQVILAPEVVGVAH